MGSVATPPNISERDDDRLFDGDGIFDEDGNIFDDDGDFDKEDEGVFADKTSIFSTPRSPSEDHRNPITTKAQEIVRYERPIEDRAIVRQRSQLVAKFDSNGIPWVCRHIGGKPVEKFRRPTAEEFARLKKQGRLVKGGLGDAPVQDAQIVNAKKSWFSSRWKWLLLAGTLGAGGVAAYTIYRRRQAAGEGVIETEEVEG